MRKFIASGYYLVVELDRVGNEVVSDGGIVIPQPGGKKAAAQLGEKMATVIDIGPCCWVGFEDRDGNYPAWCEVGDKIMLAQHGGQGLPVPDSATAEEKERLGRMRLIRDKDVLCRVED